MAGDMATALRRLTVLAWVLLEMVAVAGCANRAQRIDAQAASWGMQRRVVPGTEFQHVVYVKGLGRDAAPVHVYLEGDGVPWVRRLLISNDPTPYDALMLRMMAGDVQPSVYLGRPCYLGMARRPPCNWRLWTEGRYSARVVSSMAAALRRIPGIAGRPLRWFGHSGGGTLAMLLAERFPRRTETVLTLAGNLDPVAWTAHHGYLPLHGSLNPASRPPLPDHIRQLHYAGGRDRNVLPALIKPVVERQANARWVELPGFDHVCCWERLWPKILRGLAPLP